MSCGYFPYDRASEGIYSIRKLISARPKVYQKKTKLCFGSIKNKLTFLAEKNENDDAFIWAGNEENWRKKNHEEMKCQLQSRWICLEGKRLVSMRNCAEIFDRMVFKKFDQFFLSFHVCAEIDNF